MFKKHRNLTLSLIGLLALGIPPAQAINIGVSPFRIETEIKSKSRSQSIRVLNISSKPVEIKAVVQSWVMNENNNLEVVAPSEQSLAQWIVFTPSKFTIPAGGAQTVRFAIRPKVQPQAGEHRAVIYFQETAPNDSKFKGVRVLAKLGVVIYGYVGDIKRVGVLNSVTVDTKSKALSAVFDVSSQGNAYVRLGGQYTIWTAAQYPGAEATKSIPNLDQPEAKLPAGVLDAGGLPISPILPDSRRQLRLPINKTLPPGNYVLDINGDLNGTPINKGIPFTVPAVQK